MRAALYIRVSTEEQAREGHSIGAQQDRLVDFCRSQGWEIVEVYVDDGYSAKDLNRPAIQRLLKDCERRKFDVVVIYRLDRLVRNVLDLYHVIQHFERHGVMMKSATEIYDTTTAMGRFFITLVGAIAQWERENLAERVKMGMEKNFRKGGWNGGEVPYGYRVVDGKLVVYEPEAAIVRRIFEMYRYHGARHIAWVLNREGLRTRKGALWTDFTVRSIIENPVYSGRRRWSGIVIDGDHEPIVTREEQEEAWRLMRKRYIDREKTEKCFPFTGVLRCARCGERMHGGEYKRKRNGPYRFYRCRGRFVLGTCDLPIVAEDTLERLLLDHLQLIVDGKWAYDVEIDDGNRPDDEDQLREQLERELEEIKRRKRKWQMAFANDVITMDELRERMAEERAREETIMQQLSQLGQSIDHPVRRLTPQEVIEFARELRDKWAYFEPEHKKAAIQTLFEEIVVDVVGEAVGGPGRRAPAKIVAVKTR